MEAQQINLKIPANLLIAAQNYAKNFGYRNIQDLATTSIREKVFAKNEVDLNKELEEWDNLSDDVLVKFEENL